MIHILQIVFGLAFALFIPGYLLALIFFKELSNLEKVALGFVFSICIDVFLGLFLGANETMKNITGGITAGNIWLGLLIISGLLFFVYMLRFRPKKKITKQVSYGFKKNVDIFKKNIGTFKKSNFKVLLLYLIILSILGYLIPVIAFHQPFGTDVYSHLYMTSVMSETKSLEGFYIHLLELHPLGSSSEETPPFGMWFFGAMIRKITNLSFRQISIVLPIINLISICLCFFLFSNLFLKNKNHSLWALIFFLSVPIVVTTVLTWVTRVFVIPFFLMSFFCFFSEKINIIKRLMLFSVFSFIVVISHRATAISFMFIFLLNTFLKNIFFKNPTKRYFDYSFVFIFFPVFVFAIKSFPQLHFYYWLRLMLLEDLFGGSSLWIIQKILNYYFYIIEYNNFVYFIIIPLIFIIITELIVRLKRGFIKNVDYDKIKKTVNRILAYCLEFFSNIVYKIIKKLKIKKISKEDIQRFLKDNLVFFIIFIAISIFLITNINFRDISFGSIKSKYSLIGAIFWLGFIQCFLLLFAFKKVNKYLVILFISFLIVVVPNAELGAEFSGTTGTTRFIFFLVFLIPILAVIGLDNLFVFIKFRKIRLFLLGSILSVLLITTLIGNIYFAPEIAETYKERTGLSYLRSAPTNFYALSLLTRERVWLYGGVPNIGQNYEYGAYPIRDTKNLFATRDRGAFERLKKHGLKYIIDSKREKKEIYYRNIAMDERNNINRVYSSEEMSIYEVIP